MSSLKANCYSKGVEELKQEAKRTLRRSNDPSDILKSIDTLQRLGIAYHFEEEINDILDQLSTRKAEDNDDLFFTSLHFRLLRQHGHNVSPDVFYKFMDRKEKFKESLSRDVEGMFSLYEASCLGATGEDILSEAMKFSRNHLKTSKVCSNGHFARQVNHALQLPRHMRVERLEARSYIEEYGKENGRNSGLLDLATLDFNMVQCLHQREMMDIFMWWNELGLVERLSFARDQPWECFLWTVGTMWEPCDSKCRIELTKAIAILQVVDDIFDIYGSFDDLVLFTEAVKRWDLGAIEHLPEYMKLCYMALYNTINEIAYSVLREHGLNVITHLRKTWVDIFESYLLEAKWSGEGHIPTLEEYLANAVITGGTCMALVQTFFFMGGKTTEETVDFIDPYPKLFTCTGTILRLWDDLGTSKEESERGDVSSSIECCMRNGTSSEKDARNYVRQLILTSWKELNTQLVSPSPLPASVVKASLNMARTAQIVYEHGDDDRVAGVEDHIQLLLQKGIIHDHERLP